MIRFALPLFLALMVQAAHAQTRFRVTNVKVTEKGNTITGNDAVAEIRGSEGDDRLVLLDQDGLWVKTQVRVRTHDSNRSSVKESAVYATFEIRMKVNGKGDRRTVQKVFYGEQERRTTITEKFTFKDGINVRVITVSFEGQLE
ncbi:MAG TPA: hypothetical protein PLN54_02680 [Flavobacteriales bacterium]|nr:hypothetical protein [Flavobacteriales bacterium]